jgi:hypothetical protein
VSQPPGWPAPDQQPYESYPVQPYPSSPYPEPPYQATPYPGPAYAYQAPPPAYQPPPYQPPYPAPVGWPAPAPQPPQPPRRNGLTITLISLIGVLVVVFAVGTWWAVDSMTSDNHPVAAGDTSSTPDPGTPSATPPSPSAAATTPARTATVRLITPDTLANQPRITSSSVQSYADQASAALANLPGATSTIAAFYGTVTSTSSIFGVIGAAALVGDPKTALQTAFTSYGTGGSAITGIVSTNPGSLGGYAQCGTSNSSGSSMSICGWADSETLVMVMALGRTTTQCADLMRTVRTAIEKKN